jgi:hypothetical protein
VAAVAAGVAAAAAVLPMPRPASARAASSDGAVGFRLLPIAARHNTSMLRRPFLLMRFRGLATAGSRPAAPTVRSRVWE